MPSPEFIALVSLGLNVVVAVVGFTWGVKRIGDEIEEKIDAQRDKFELEIDRIQRQWGEVASAIRGKVQEVELFMRDNFVRNDSFFEVMRGYGTDMRAQFDKIEARLERMETKIDTK